jgi:hypothetical protein
MSEPWAVSFLGTLPKDSPPDPRLMVAPPHDWRRTAFILIAAIAIYWALMEMDKRGSSSDDGSDEDG